MIRFLFIFLIKGYQKWISPLLGNNCRFYPSCSEYAIIQLSKRNIFIALRKIIWRILRCNPFHPGGYDLD